VTDRPVDPDASAHPDRVVARDATGQDYVEDPVPVSTPGAHPDQGGGVDRGLLILEGLRGAAAWAWRFLLVVAAVAVFFYIVGKLWVGVLPLLMALIVSTVLWPPVRFLTRRRWPSGLASGVVLLLALGVFLGSLAAIAPGIVSQGQVIVRQAGQGLQVVVDWLEGPPLNLQNEQISAYVNQASDWLQQRSSDIASGVLSGVSTAGSVIVTLALVLVLTFFFLKDGERFGPWVRRFAGPTAGMHLTEALARMWVTLGGFIRAQALVSFVDAVFIGIGLLILGVPLAFGLALITFFAGFIPIVGAVTAGALAVLVALVSEGFGTALWVLAIVLLVQQIEGNVLSPLLQSRAMDLHPVVILLAVAAGGTRWGIVGAFLAVPVTATLVSVIRYASEHLDLRSGTVRADELQPLTAEGREAARLAEESAPVFQLRAQQAHQRVAQERDVARAERSRSTSIAAAIRERVLRARGRSPEDVVDTDTDADPDEAPPQPSRSSEAPGATDHR
jgi:putative heme transporter